MPPVQSHGHNVCPVLCITKVCLYVLTTLFVLYLPLGDPQVICNEKNVPENQKGLICFCNIYDFLMRMGDKTVQTIDRLACAILDGLYEAKIKFYAVLSKYDRNDYCRIGSCQSIEALEDNHDPRPRCRCKNKRCKKR